MVREMVGTEPHGGDVVGAFYDAYNAGNAEAAAALYAADGWHEEAHNGARRAGRQALRESLERFFAFLPDAHWERREAIAAGASVAVVYTLKGHLGIDLKGAPTKGLPITLDGIHVFEIADGAIAGTRDYWDPAAFARQIAAAPKAETGAGKTGERETVA